MCSHVTQQLRWWLCIERSDRAVNHTSVSGLNTSAVLILVKKVSFMLFMYLQERKGSVQVIKLDRSVEEEPWCIRRAS